MNNVDRDKLYKALKIYYWEPDLVYIKSVNFGSYEDGIQIRVDQLNDVSMNQIPLMNSEDVERWLQSYAFVKIEQHQVRLYRPMINKKRELYYLPKNIYNIKNFRNETDLAKRIIKDLTVFFNIKQQF